jgi:hypothetical protein
MACAGPEVVRLSEPFKTPGKWAGTPDTAALPVPLPHMNRA